MTMSSRQSCIPPGQLFKHVVEMVEVLGEEGSGHEQRPKVDKHYHDTVQMTLTIPGVTLAPSLHYPLTPLLITNPTNPVLTACATPNHTADADRVGRLRHPFAVDPVASSSPTSSPREALGLEGAPG
jgi:hypothetical protein